MKTLIYIIIAGILPVLCFAQKDKTKKYDDPQNMDVVVEQDAHYPAGEQMLYQYIYNNIKYPKKTKGKTIIGEVFLSFNVETDSTVTDISVISGAGYGIDEEVVRVLKSLKFAPSIQNGVQIKMNLMLSIPIRIRNE